MTSMEDQSNPPATDGGGQPHQIHCMVETEKDKLNSCSEVEKESSEVISQHFYGSMFRRITVATGSCSSISYGCACNHLILVISQSISRLGNIEKAEASCPAIFMCEPCQRHKLFVFMVEASSVIFIFSQIGEKAKSKKRKSMRTTSNGLWMDSRGCALTFTFLVTMKEGRQVSMALGYLNCGESGCPPTFKLLCMHHIHVPSSLAFRILPNAPLMLTTGVSPSGGGEGEGDWSLLPVLLIWMIKDKLDIFDNMRFAAVCRLWRSASACYPKVLQSVGDGFPWIWQSNPDIQSSLCELFSVTRRDKDCNKLRLNIPELSGALVIFSKQGWIFLRGGQSNYDQTPGSLFLYNPFTKGKIELPSLQMTRSYAGLFTTLNGHPHRVFLVRRENIHQMTIKTACPGDQTWTDHIFYSGPAGTSFSSTPSVTVVWQNDVVYLQDARFRIMGFNLMNDSWEQLTPPVSPVSYGFIADHDGQLLFIERGRRCDSFAVYRYSAAASSWERLNNSAVMDTSWFLCPRYGCISAKGKGGGGGGGIKVYSIRKRGPGPGLGRARQLTDYIRTDIEVHDVVTASKETLHLPFQIHHSACWVNIG